MKNSRHPSASSLYEKARTKLALNVIPEQLLGRENEINNIMVTIRSAISTNQGLTMYIAGETGTGKTACIREVLRVLKKQECDDEEMTEKSIPKFKILFINAMKLKSTKEAYERLWSLLCSHKSKKQKNLKRGVSSQQITKLFSTHSPKRPYLVVVIDELDFLVTKNQQEVYEFFNWPQIKTSKLCVIGIANTVNLPEQLAPKIASRIEMTQRITFEAYKYEQISAIIQERVKEFAIFDDKAIEYCSKKVANLYGDIRRGFDICRRAAEIVEEKYMKQVREAGSKTLPLIVSMRDINDAFKDLFNVSTNYPLEQLSIYHKLFLFCTVQEHVSMKDKAEYKLENIISRMQTQLKKHHKSMISLNSHEIMAIVDMFQDMELIQLKRVGNERMPLIRFDNIEIESISDALTKDLEMKQFY